MDTIKTHLLILGGKGRKEKKIVEMEDDRVCEVKSCIWCSPQLDLVCCKSNRTDFKHPLCNAKPSLQMQMLQRAEGVKGTVHQNMKISPVCDSKPV